MVHTVPSEVMSLAGLSSCLPTLPDTFVERDNLLVQIEDSSIDSRLVVVRGREGAGKSTLLASFVHQHKDDAVSIFLSGADRMT